MTFGNGKSWIPPDFDPKKSTLLIEVEDPAKGVGKKMLNYMKNNYPYPFECVSKTVIYAGKNKYEDVSTYRFALMRTSYTIQSSDIRRPFVEAKDFYFYDRKADKDYPRTGKGSSGSLMTFKPIINTIVKYFR